MAAENKKRRGWTAYHCAFLLEQSNRLLRIGMAWKRVGAADYGVYIAPESKESSVTYFKAQYSGRGVMEHFWVSDKKAAAGDNWQEDHLTGADWVEELPAIGSDDAEVLDELAEAFSQDWFESYGKEEAEELARSVGFHLPENSRPLEDLTGNGLPLQVQREKMPEILRRANLTESKKLYAILSMPDIERELEGPAKEMLEKQMKLFFELI